MIMRLAKVDTARDIDTMTMADWYYVTVVC